ncbi:MAG: PAS domain S-box protein [Rickettsiales bacterium]
MDTADIPFFDSHLFMPHGHCFLWQPEILWLHVLADAGVAGAYFSIPFALYYFVRKRRDLPFPKIFLLFGAFILLCGSSHLMGIWVLWHPDYALEGVIKAMTAAVSIATFFVLVRLMPKALQLASPDQLAALNERLRGANRELESLYQQSEASGESRLRAVVDHILSGIITIDASGRIESLNPASEQIFGYNSTEAIGMEFTALLGESHRAAYAAFFASPFSPDCVIRVNTRVEIEGCRSNGRAFPMEFSISPFALGDTQHYCGIVRDITERREAEKIHEQLRHVQKMDSLGQLTGGVAHDFNNLLAIILGNLDFLNEKLDADSPLRRFVAPSIAAAEHGADLTKQLLAFGRKQALQPKIIDLNELLHYFTVLVRHTLGERIEIITRPAPGLWVVNVDPSQLQNAMLNLAVNARDAMTRGGKLIFETSNITLDTDYARLHTDLVAGQYVQLAVSDTGEGMSAEIIEKAFEPFFTTKEVGRGSGLGLSMVYGFIKQSRGHIKIYSELGHGTSIKIYLPRADGTPEISTPNDTVMSSDEKKETLILVVEDNAEVLALTSAMVASLGYQVLHAIDGDAALAIFKTRDDIALLLTDVMLPGSLNGPALAAKAQALQPTLKVLFNSGYAEHAIMQSGLLDEGVHLIGKPFRKRELAAKLEEVLREG